MPDSLTADERKLEWCGRLCALLLNDGTDVLRWFLLDNLPRMEDCEVNLNSILKENRTLFIELLKQPKRMMNQEMFDILYGEKNDGVDIENLEIYLLYILIRFLCKLKHPFWKWWDEEPLNHQQTPIFDVIRLFRFKQRMQEIVHNYKITEEMFDELWVYVTTVLDRLNCYKLSSRRWLIGSMKTSYCDDVSRTYNELTDVMRWQTLDLNRRDEVYLVQKQNRESVRAKDHEIVVTWNEFLSQFGQKRKFCLTQPDSPKQRELVALNCYSENKEISFLDDKTLSCEAKHSSRQQQTKNAFTDSVHNFSIQSQRKSLLKDNLTVEEKHILESVNNNSYLKELEDFNIKHIGFVMQHKMRELYITANSHIIPLGCQPSFKLHMDKVIINLEQIKCDRTSDVFLEDVPLLRATKTTLTSWRDMLNGPKPLRLLIGGEWSSGKTTFLKKISHEWATQNTLQLQTYRFVFYIDLALIKPRKPYTSLSECIIEQCCSHFSVDEIDSVFKNSDGNHILLLLDSAERMPDARSDVMSEISDVICGKRWPHFSVILTTVYADVENYSDLPHLYSNIKYFIEQSSVPKTRFRVIGFTSHDVITHSRGYFEASSNSVCNFMTKEFLDFVRVFQRDVYKGVMATPVMTYLLCHLWRSKPGNFQQSTTPETLGSLFQMYLEIFHLSIDYNTEFCTKTLQFTLEGNLGNIYTLSDITSMGNITKIGLLQSSTQDDLHMKFSCVLFEEYIAAKCFCSTLKNEEDMRMMIEDHVSSLQSIIRLRHFLLFCCSLSSQAGEVITCLISDLMERSNKETRASDRSSITLQEAAKHLTLQCFYEMNEVTPKSFLHCCENQGDNDRAGSELHILSTSLLSHRTKQSILFLTSQCRPLVNQSGIVFTFLDQSFFWIRTLHLSQIKGNQMSFIASLLKNLAFLEEANFNDVYDINDDDISDLCNGLTHYKANSSYAALHSLIITLRSTSPFDYCRLSTYASVGRLLEHLPYLETLNLTILNSKIFFSLFCCNSGTVVPLSVIDMSQTGFNEDNCRLLATLLHRLTFVQTLVLSNNPLKNGFEFVCQTLHCLRNLQVIDVSSACLTPRSVSGLARLLRESEVSSKLKKLDIHGNEVQDQTSMSEIAAAVALLNNLEYLDVSSNYLGDDAACMLAKSLSGHKRIHTIKLDSVQIGPVALSAFKYFLRECLNLCVVSFSGNYFDAELLQFMEVLRPTCESSRLCGASNLQDVDLSGINDNFSISVSSEAITHLINSLQRHKNIKRICIRHIEIKNCDLIRLLNSCQEHASLEELHFSAKFVPFTSTQKESWSCLRVS